MKFPRSKKVVFCNNKGGVGKTTLTFHTAHWFAKEGYKVLLVDLDPQCNLTLHALGVEYFERNLFSDHNQTVYSVVKGFVEGETGVDFDVKPTKLSENLSILPGDMSMVYFEELIPNALGDAAKGNPRGFIQTSAIDRYLNKIAVKEDFDLIMIDTSPNLGPLNQVILLGTDYFVVPATPDVFSVQGIENLGKVVAKWKETWKLSAVALSKQNDNIPSANLLSGEGLFAGYIVNAYHLYLQPIKNHRNWMEEINKKVRDHLSNLHSKNGLVQFTNSPLAQIKDYGKIASMAQEKLCAMFDLQAVDLGKEGTIENWQRSKNEFELLYNNLLQVLMKW